MYSELEGVINSRDCCFKFLNRSVPIFPKNCPILKPNEQKLLKVKAPFIDGSFRVSHNQDFGWRDPQYSLVKIKIHAK